MRGNSPTVQKKTVGVEKGAKVPDIKITNCHVHLFTTDHVPNGYAGGLIRLVKVNLIRRPLAWILRRRTLRWIFGEKPGRVARFAEIADQEDQGGVFEAVEGYYPSETRFVVLPMDMKQMGYGDPDEDLPAQHDALARLAAAKPGRVLPFAAVDPRRPDAFAELRRCVEEHGFRGVKLYPPLGYAPTDPRLKDVYKYCVDKNLPVLSHCSRGGVREKGMKDDRQADLAGPAAFLPVLEEHKDLRVCLAHFGGWSDWKEYLNKTRRSSIEPRAAFRTRNWLAHILDLLRSGKYPNLWTDISYTAFEIEKNIPALDVFLNDEKVASRVLFGSDFYMTEMEETSERRVSIELRHRLRDEKFRQIAETNPAIWLGETS